MPSRFKVLKSLEDNTTSTLQLVRDSHLKSDFLLRRFKTTDAGEIEGLVRLFAQLAVIESPHLDRIVEAGMDQKGFFVLTPAPLEGITLTEMIQRGPLSADEFEVLVTQILDAVELVHDRSMVHGTLTPDCVRIVGVKPSEWVVKLGGFGVGFSAAGTEVSQQVAAYRCAAPEQWQKTAARRRTDIYSLGCVFYEALAGRPAFQSRGLKELRAKHLSHDIQDLAVLAPHVPRWMTAWVMSLIVTDSEVRPRKASVAREYLLNQNAPEVVPASLSVLVAPVEAPAVALHAVVSEPVALPITQPARTATASTIPIHVGPQVGPAPAPRRAAPPAVLPKAVAKHFSQQPKPRPMWQKPMVIGIACVAVGVAVSLLFWPSGEPVGSSGAGMPPLFDAPATDPQMQTLRELGAYRQRYYAGRARVGAPAYPNGMSAPFAASRLVLHLDPDFGVGTYDGAAGDKPARDGDAVAFWHDLGVIQGDNAMAMVPWNSRDHRITLRVRKPDSRSFDLRGPRRFVEFGKGSRPVSALGTLGALSGKEAPFGDSSSSGTTFAIIFYADASADEGTQYPARLSFSNHGLSLLFSRPTMPRIFLGSTKSPELQGYLELPRGIEMDCTLPTLAIATWGRDGRATGIFRNSAGERHQVTQTVPPPDQSLQNIALGGEAYWTFRDAKDVGSAFYGGIGECRLYNGSFSADELKKLEEELARHYFP